MAAKKGHKRATRFELLKRTFFLLIGAAIVALALEMFLIPNSMIDGGIVGISIMLSHLSGISLGIFLILLNIPFLIMGYKQIGKTFVFSTLFAVIVMSIGTKLLHHIKPFTEEPLLASIFGGILMGIGVGLVIRYGGSTDGIEISAVILSNRIPFSVGEAVMFFNFFILVSAGFVFGWDSAMYSLISYFIAFKMIDIVVEGLDESKSAWIISEIYEEVGSTIQDRLGRGVTYISSKGGFKGEERHIIYCVFSRLEEAKLKQIIREVDPHASFTIENVHDVEGKAFGKRSIH